MNIFYTVLIVVGDLLVEVGGGQGTNEVGGIKVLRGLIM